MDEDDFFRQTIVVWEEPDIRPSLVLDARGEPFALKRVTKMGFDLTPKENNNDREAQRQTCVSLQESS